MKNFLLILTFITATSAFSALSAQTTMREPASSAQKSDDGVLVAYPNPAKDFLIVKSKDSSLKIKSVSFYSILGMHIITNTVNSNTAEINVERLKPGKYLVRYIMSDNTQRVTQIIKQ